MKTKARDLMTRNFRTLRPQMTIAEAARAFDDIGEREQRVFGMVVTDDRGRLVGMLSMYDILLFMRPKGTRLWEDLDDAEVDLLMENVFAQAKNTLVADVMTTDVITITPDTHLIKIMEIMIRRHIRRLPVIDREKIVGMVYISHLFHYLCEKMSS